MPSKKSTSSSTAAKSSPKKSSKQSSTKPKGSTKTAPSRKKGEVLFPDRESFQSGPYILSRQKKVVAAIATPKTDEQVQKRFPGKYLGVDASPLRELTKEEKSRIFWTIDNEGLDYAIQNYLSKQVEGTVLEPYVESARKALDDLEKALEENGVTEEGLDEDDAEDDE